MAILVTLITATLPILASPLQNKTNTGITAPVQQRPPGWLQEKENVAFTKSVGELGLFNLREAAEGDLTAGWSHLTE